MSYGSNTITVQTNWDADDIREHCGGIAGDLTDEQMDEVIDRLGEWFSEAPTEDDLDEFFRFEGDTIAEWLCFKDEEHLQFALDNIGHRIFYCREDGTFYTDDELDAKFESYKKLCERDGDECDYSDWEDWANDICDEVEGVVEE